LVSAFCFPNQKSETGSNRKFQIADFRKREQQQSHPANRRFENLKPQQAQITNHRFENLKPQQSQIANHKSENAFRFLPSTFCFLLSDFCLLHSLCQLRSSRSIKASASAGPHDPAW
jgi:hypothetical protein